MSDEKAPEQVTLYPWRDMVGRWHWSFLGSNPRPASAVDYVPRERLDAALRKIEELLCETQR